ncbi:hypothetical protein B566_EDAN006372 [Ephemera danica]|nr:hypothetical protein B566_EDAN006372 [Ephemera danica]
MIIATMRVNELGNEEQHVEDAEMADAVSDEVAEPIHLGCDDHWTWNQLDCSHEVRLHGPGHRSALFHPNWSSGTAGVRGTRVLNNCRYYWEVCMSHRIFGTSMMVGVCTKKARLHADRFINLLGEDKNGWGLSHKGLLWHAGKWSPYTKPFRENEATTVGVLFDGVAGTITFFKDGKSLGVAFQGLDKVQEPLYPVLCSTAAKTEMTLTTMKRDFVSLQDRCRAVIVTKLLQSRGEIETVQPEQGESSSSEAATTIETNPVLDQLYLPRQLKMYIAEALQEAILLQSLDSG